MTNLMAFSFLRKQTFVCQSVKEPEYRSAKDSLGLLPSSVIRSVESMSLGLVASYGSSSGEESEGEEEAAPGRAAVSLSITALVGEKVLYPEQYVLHTVK